MFMPLDENNLKGAKQVMFVEMINEFVFATPAVHLEYAVLVGVALKKWKEYMTRIAEVAGFLLRRVLPLTDNLFSDYLFTLERGHVERVEGLHLFVVIGKPEIKDFDFGC